MSSTVAPKRSRKKIVELSSNKSVIEELVSASATSNDTWKETPDKKTRGRKSKVLAIPPKEDSAELNTSSTSAASAANIILQLKCCLKDLRDYNSQYNNCMTNPTEYNPAVPPSIMTYNEDTQTNFFPYDKTSSTEESEPVENIVVPAEKETVIDEFVCSRCGDCGGGAASANKSSNQLQQKVKKLKIQLYKSISEGPGKQAACFWCTYDFDTPACYIPKYETEDAMHAYGSFCSPNCAAAYLLNETINDSIRFERYTMLNWIYGENTDIQPAPNPHYTLQKFYGNLTIQEFRRLTQSDHHRLIVLERPLTRILPELHEETNATRVQQPEELKGMGGFRVRKESEKASRASKADIVRDRFGVNK